MSKPTPRAAMLVGACRELYAAIDRLDHEAASTAGVPRSDLRALNLLEKGPVRAGDLAEALGLTTGAVTTLIDRLERRGLATRERDPSDRRVVLVHPTPVMFQKLAPLYRRVAARLEQLADSYSDEELEAALEHLSHIVGAYTAAAQHE